MLPVINIKLGNSNIKIKYLDNSQESLYQVITLYSNSGIERGNAYCVFNKKELDQYIDMLRAMYGQMEE